MRAYLNAVGRQAWNSTKREVRTEAIWGVATAVTIYGLYWIFNRSTDLISILILLLAVPIVLIGFFVKNLLTSGAQVYNAQKTYAEQLDVRIAELEAGIQTFRNQQHAREMVRSAAGAIRNLVEDWKLCVGRAQGGMPSGSTDPHDWAEALRTTLGEFMRQVDSLGFGTVATHISQQAAAFKPADEHDAYSRAREIAATLDAFSSSGELDPGA